MSISLALLITVGIAHADVFVLFPNGDFEDSTSDAWGEAGGGAIAFSYPTTGGNPGGFAIIDANLGDPFAWAVLVGGAVTPLPIAPMGLVPGVEYTFEMDMKPMIATFPTGGLKLESWGPGGIIGNSGDVRPPTVDNGDDWATYQFKYTLEPGTTGIKVVPLWEPDSVVGFDNIGVIVPPQPLIASITSPDAGATVSNIFYTIEASATVSPAAVTQVSFYEDDVLLGTDDTYPYSFTRNGATVGGHTLKVVAEDSDGGSVTSALVAINVADIPPPVTSPAENAPLPTRPASQVLSLYNSSGTYQDQATGGTSGDGPINWYASWGSIASQTDFTIAGGNTVKCYKGLQFAGVELDPTYAVTTDASGMTHLHIDVWTTADQFAIKLVSVGAEELVIYLPSSGVIIPYQWVSLDIPLTAWTDINPGLDLANLIQLLWVDKEPDLPPGGITGGDFYFDNIYFYNDSEVVVPEIISVTEAGGNLVMEVPSETGFDYVLEGNSTLDPSTWMTVETMAGTGAILTFSVPITPGAQYYRVRLQSPTP